MIASKKGHADVVKYLLGRPNIKVNVAEIHIYEKFIKFPIDYLWNFFSKFNYTALLYACSLKFYPEIVKLLTQYKGIFINCAEDISRDYSHEIAFCHLYWLL